MAMEIIRTGAAAGAEVRGIDLSEPIEPDQIVQIERSFDDCGVVFLRQQSITPTQQINFAECFGQLEHNFNSEIWGVSGHPELFVVSNIEKDGHPIGPPRVGETWHSDMSYSANPPRATMLHAIEVPSMSGLTLGDTEFANAAAAYDDLPQSMKARIERLIGVFDFNGRKRARPVSDEIKKRYPPVRHPIVRQHPRTGRKSLYVMRDDCTSIEGLPDAEGRALITALADHITHPKFVYRHQWQTGDVLMWDNCTVQHKAIIDYALPHRRLMHRTTMGYRSSEPR